MLTTMEREQSSIGIDVERIERAYTEKDVTGRTLGQDYGRGVQAGYCQKGIGIISLVLTAPILGVLYGIALLFHIETPLAVILYCTLCVQPMAAAGLLASQRWKQSMLQSEFLSQGIMFVLSGFCNGEDHLACSQFGLLVLSEMMQMACLTTCLMSAAGILLSFDEMTDNRFLLCLYLIASLLPAIGWYFLFRKTCIRLEPIKFRRHLVNTEEDQDDSLCGGGVDDVVKESDFEPTKDGVDNEKSIGAREIV